MRKKYLGFGLGAAVGVWLILFPLSGRTAENVQIAFIADTSASLKYLAYGQRADEEGLPLAARLFRAAAESKRIEADGYRGLLTASGLFNPTTGRYDGVPGTTRQNLTEALGSEQDEIERTLPGMQRVSRQERQTEAVRLFGYAQGTGQEHVDLFTQAIQSSGSAPEVQNYLICPVCGATFAGKAPDYCPNCGTTSTKFEHVS